MANHTRAWNDAYEDLPPNSGENASIGASRIRDLKDDIRERMVVDHTWKDGLTAGSEDGEHTKITLEQRANPTNVVDRVILFAKDYNNGTDTKAELHIIDEDGTVLQITNRGRFYGPIIPQNSQSGNYTLALTDIGKDIVFPSGHGAGDILTIPANASVAFPVGVEISIYNLDSNTVSIQITTDTLTLAGSTSTGTRTLAQNGVAVLKKMTSAGWLISGIGVT